MIDMMVADNNHHFKGMSKEILDFKKETGEQTLWTNSMFGGMPAYQISVQYTGNVIGYLDKVFRLWLPRPADLVFLYLLGFYVLLISLKADPWLAIAGAIAFAFSSYFFIILEAGHNSKAHAIGYMPLVVSGILMVFRGKKLVLGGIITAVFLSLELKTNHLQITYYLALTMMIFAGIEAYLALRSKQLKVYGKKIGILACACVLALMTNITTIWATYEYGQHTIRGKSELTLGDKADKTSGLDKGYATQWSYGIGETFTLLVPGFSGGSGAEPRGEGSVIYEDLMSRGVPKKQAKAFVEGGLPLYYGDQPFTSGPVYIGAVVVFLAILALFLVSGPLKWWLLSATIMSIMLAWGKHFMVLTEFMLDYFPGYNKFRAVSMTLVIAQFAENFLRPN